MNYCDCGNVLDSHLKKVCKECKKEKIKVRKEKNLEVIRNHKNRPCHDCGGVFPHFVMDLDHRDPDQKEKKGGKKNRSSYVWAKSSPEKIQKLLSICDVICANCHRIRTHKKEHNLINQPTNFQEKTSKDPKASEKVKERGRQAAIIIHEIKSNGSCMDCGKRYDPVAMDFDHREDKKLSVSSMVRMKPTKTTLLKEISKCDLVCANCHRIRTHAA